MVDVKWLFSMPLGCDYEKFKKKSKLLSPLLAAFGYILDPVTNYEK